MKRDILKQIIYNKIKEIEKEITPFEHEALKFYDQKVARADLEKINDQLEKVQIKKEEIYKTLYKVFENDFHYIVKAAQILTDELNKRTPPVEGEKKWEVDFSEDTMLANFEFEKSIKS